MQCNLCNRENPNIHKHHIIPKIIWRRLKRRRQVKGNAPKVALCNDCGTQIHMLFTTKELAEMPWEDLKRHPEIVKYVEWIKDKPTGIKMRMSRRLKHDKTR